MLQKTREKMEENFTYKGVTYKPKVAASALANPGKITRKSAMEKTTGLLCNECIFLN